MQVRSLGQEDPLEVDMATHSSILAWRIPWTEEPGRLLSVGSQWVGPDWSDWVYKKTNNLRKDKTSPVCLFVFFLRHSEAFCKWHYKKLMFSTGILMDIPMNRPNGCGGEGRGWGKSALGESQEHVRPQFLISKCRLWEWFVESKTMVNTGDFLKLTWY